MINKDVGIAVPAPVGFTESLFRGIGAAEARLVTQIESLEDLADRFFGPTPAKAEEVDGHAVGCITEGFLRRVAQLDRVADRLEMAVSRLSQLI